MSMQIFVGPRSPSGNRPDDSRPARHHWLLSVAFSQCKYKAVSGGVILPEGLVSCARQAANAKAE